MRELDEQCIGRLLDDDRLARRRTLAESRAVLGAPSLRSATMRQHFDTHGWVRVPNAFSSDAAAAMRDVLWRALAERGICRDDPNTWTDGRPFHLQHLKSAPAFSAVGTARTIAAISTVLGYEDWHRPHDWGAFFLVFPTSGVWDVQHDGWHLDADYAGPLTPSRGVKVHAMFGDVEPRAGGMNIISGSHRVVHRWFEQNAPKPGARAAQLRKELIRGVPYLRDLCTPGDPGERIARFHDSEEVVDGVQLRVLENTAAAGDVILMHPLLLHAPPVAHLGATPRFVLNKDLTR
jgi:ectoine hydroxylase-related dioxygenase (phytanoyl-CoA dioxygenase family)